MGITMFRSSTSGGPWHGIVGNTNNSAFLRRFSSMCGLFFFLNHWRTWCPKMQFPFNASVIDIPQAPIKR
eukprot:7861709-Karenia_brevis.AAC.1